MTTAITAVTPASLALVPVVGTDDLVTADGTFYVRRTAGTAVTSEGYELTDLTGDRDWHPWAETLTGIRRIIAAVATDDDHRLDDGLTVNFLRARLAATLQAAATLQSLGDDELYATRHYIRMIADLVTEATS